MSHAFSSYFYKCLLEQKKIYAAITNMRLDLDDEISWTLTTSKEGESQSSAWTKTYHRLKLPLKGLP